jgi:hypothetical protein
VARLLLSERACLARLDLSLSLLGVMTVRDHVSLVHHVAKAEGRGRG